MVNPKFLSSTVALFLIVLSYFIINRNYYVKEWLTLKPIHDHASQFFCNNFINCTDVNLLMRNKDDLIFCKKMSVSGSYLYYKTFANSASSDDRYATGEFRRLLLRLIPRLPVWVISHWDHVLDPDRQDVVYVFVDGEPDDLDFFDEFAPRMVYIGHKINHSYIKPAKSIFLPYLVTSFIERKLSPKQLVKPGHFEDKRYFAAYLASNCVPMREQSYNLLYEFAKEHQLGEVHALGQCYGKYKESHLRIQNDSRTSADFLISAVEIMKNYKYVLTFENTYQHGYVTEKIISPILAHAVPIYFGSDVVLDFIDSETFFYVKTIEDLKKVLTKENFSETKRRAMVERPKMKESAYYYFSLYDDVRALMTNSDRRTILDDILDAVKSFSRKAN